MVLCCVIKAKKYKEIGGRKESRLLLINVEKILCDAQFLRKEIVVKETYDFPDKYSKTSSELFSN